MRNTNLDALLRSFAQETAADVGESYERAVEVMDDEPGEVAAALGTTVEAVQHWVDAELRTLRASASKYDLVIEGEGHVATFHAPNELEALATAERSIRRGEYDAGNVVRYWVTPEGAEQGDSHTLTIK